VRRRHALREGCDLRLQDAGNRPAFRRVSYINLEAGVRTDHPLRSARAVADEALGAAVPKVRSVAMLTATRT